MSETFEQGGSGRTISRRTVAKGAAWSVPAVVMATSAPALASSPPIIIDFAESSACKLPGTSWKDRGYDKGYVLWAMFENTLDTQVSFRVLDIFVGGVDMCLVGVTDPAVPSPCPPTQFVDCITLDPGQKKVYGVFSNTSANSASNEVQVKVEYWVGSSSCGAAGTGTIGTPSGQVVGESWTGPNGEGSCDFPYAEENMCLTPPDAGACKVA